MSQSLAIAGFLLAFFYALTGLARMQWALAGRALLLGVLATTLLSILSPSLRVSAALRLTLDRADYAEAIQAYQLTGQARCNCLLSTDYAAFRWHRSPQGWRGVMRQNRETSSLDFLTVRRAPLWGDWALIDVAGHPRQ